MNNITIINLLAQRRAAIFVIFFFIKIGVATAFFTTAAGPKIIRHRVRASTKYGQITAEKHRYFNTQ